MITLEEALDFGRGIERPFCCPAHPDMHASASVNVAKGVWVCYACTAKGRVDGKRVPTDAELEAMLRPETATRVYPASWLELFTTEPGYWTSRFPDWLCRWAELGTDPVTGDATFPVHTAEGRLAGVGRRRSYGDARYLYPPAWAASRSLGFLPAARGADWVVLVEGYADAVACWGVGAPALPCYGSGVHHPQRELVARLAPKLIVAGFDADGAGRAAIERAHDTLGDLAELVDVNWETAGGKDPAEVEDTARTALLIETVRASTYGRRATIDADMTARVTTIHAASNRKE